MRIPWQTIVQPTVEEILRTSQVPGMVIVLTQEDGDWVLNCMGIRCTTLARQKPHQRPSGTQARAAVWPGVTRRSESPGPCSAAAPLKAGGRAGLPSVQPCSTRHAKACGRTTLREESNEHALANHCAPNG